MMDSDDIFPHPFPGYPPVEIYIVHPKESRRKGPNEWFTGVILPLILTALPLFLGADLIQNMTGPQSSNENISTVCTGYYKDIGELIGYGLNNQGLAQIEDPRERTCGEAHTVPYILESPSGSENATDDKGFAPEESESEMSDLPLPR